ncbi:two-component system sensor histidine kinase NtrB [Hyalangium rubrum]|uniref:histidine kinase n=1 Tax=Hyalangium rubrum TaxID=3103134 RepID=A0ABU5H014_9BACT|nr:ATP-binding protein [Hyalangium sp. s54d21]MDY7226788.1 ATP-binding protein [Hyalangium sp. s54d21]
MRHPIAGFPKPREPRAPHVAARAGFFARLDKLLSEPLRNAPPSELIRNRIMAGAALFLFLSTVLYILTHPFTPKLAPTLFANLGYLSTLVVLRRARTHHAPARLLFLVLCLGLFGSVFVSESPLGSIHAATMLLPALAVYLLGPRWGFAMTLLVIGVLGILHPLYYTSVHSGPLFLPREEIWPLHIAASVSFVGAWGLGALHSTARRSVQESLEQTLQELRDSESKLSSVIESTGDVVISMDPQGRVLTANSAAKQLYLQYFGKPIEVGVPLFEPAPPALRELWEQRIAQVCAGERLHVEEESEHQGVRVVVDVRAHPLHGADGRLMGLTLFSRDITARKQAENRLGEMHRTLVDVSRQAGMAEVATGVLHNVGNTLNSVNISTSLLAEMLGKSRVVSLAKATQLLREHGADMSTFLSSDPQGQKLPAYFIALSEHLLEERDTMSKELVSLTQSVDHIKSIISMQQKHARTAGSIEQLAVPQLIDEALRLHAVSFERMGILIEREYAAVPPILVDRHKLLQILINLLSNARHALVDSGRQDKRMTIRIRLSPDAQRLLIEVADNGVGIAPEHTERLFTQGFTTKKTGHGFGLHISSLAATEMKGRLSCTSPGPGQGATFTLELPVAGEEATS